MTRLAILLLAASAADAAPPRLPAEAKVPYRLEVVVTTDGHAHFTPQFRAGLIREVGARLQAGLGRLAAVRVRPLADIPPAERSPVVKAFAENGFDALPRFNELTGVKTHFVGLRYEGGGYAIRSRQHDGSTGLASPLTRVKRTPLRRRLARLTVLAVRRDFGTVGTIDMGSLGGNEVKLTLKGASVAGAPAPWVRRGEAFAVAQVLNPAARKLAFFGKDESSAAGKPPRGVRYGDAILVVSRVSGRECFGRLYGAGRGRLPRFRQIPGYRCLKLGTVTAPLTLEVTEDGTGVTLGPNRNVGVRFHEGDYPRPGSPPRDEGEFVDGAFRSRRPVRDVAFVRVTVGGDAAYQQAFPILRAGQREAMRVGLSARDADLAEFRQRADDLANRAGLTASSMDFLLTQIGKLGQGAMSNEDKKKRLAEGLSGLQADVAALRDQRVKLADDPVARDRRAAPLLRQLDETLAGLRARLAKLREFGGKLDKAIAREKDPAVTERAKALDAKLLAADALMEKAEVAEALKLYQDVLKASDGDTAALKGRIAKIEKVWKLKGDAHRKAREAVYRDMPKVETYAELREILPRLGEAVAECRRVGDFFTLRKANSEIEQMAARLKRLGNPTDADEVAAVRRAAELSGAINDALDATRGKE